MPLRRLLFGAGSCRYCHLCHLRQHTYSFPEINGCPYPTGKPVNYQGNKLQKQPGKITGKYGDIDRKVISKTALSQSSYEYYQAPDDQKGFISTASFNNQIKQNNQRDNAEIKSGGEVLYPR